MRLFTARSYLAFFLNVCSVPAAYAHHGYADYDMKHTVTLTGTVTQFTLANPHSTFAFDVKDDKGEVTHWVVEFGVVRDLVQQGWTDTTLKPGDEVKVTVHPKKDGDHAGALVGDIKYADGRALTLTPPPGQQHPYRAMHW
jgi:hypothetical protein